MNIEDVIQASASFAAAVLFLLLLASGIGWLIRRSRGKGWREQHPSLLRFVAIRLGIALGIGGCAFILIAAGLVLNSHRPPGDNTPVVTVQGARGPVIVKLDVPDCSATVEGTVSVRGGARNARIYTDRDGVREIPIDPKGFGRFEMEDGTAKRGLLSCYLQLPLVKAGAQPSRVTLDLDEQMEVDTVASVPAPDRYSSGEWVWECPAGQRCPSLATATYAVEEGSKQVIVLVLAAVFGAIIALFIGEALIEPLRKRLDRNRPGA